MDSETAIKIGVGVGVVVVIVILYFISTSANSETAIKIGVGVVVVIVVLYFISTSANPAPAPTSATPKTQEGETLAELEALKESQKEEKEEKEAQEQARVQEEQEEQARVQLEQEEQEEQARVQLEQEEQEEQARVQLEQEEQEEQARVQLEQEEQARVQLEQAQSVDNCSSWGPCSEGCGNGVQYCTGGNNSSRGCKIKDCPVTWPSYNDPAFSIKIRGTGNCLHPEGGSHTPLSGTNLVSYPGCGEDRLKYKVFADGQIQHYRPTGTTLGGKCLWPNAGNNAVSSNGDVVTLKDSCNDYYPNMAHTLRYTYEGGKIKNNKSNLCLNAEGGVTRLRDCNSATQFDLVQ